jgi:hypothetical protein
MNSADLQRLFGLNHQVLHINTKGISNEDALVQPRPAGNCLNWVVGHIVSTRNLALKALGREPFWSEDVIARYKRSSPPITGPAEGLPFDRLVQDFDRSQEQLQSALGSLTDADLAKPADEGTFAERLAFLHFHEAYHVGQTAVLRRIAGKEGAIK